MEGLNIKYMGSKLRISKYIVPIIQDYIDKNKCIRYYEPFVGGANIIDKIKCKNKYASDNNEYLIELYNNLDKINDIPDFITKAHYSEVRDCFNKKLDTYPKWYIGAIGFLASYNGRFFDGGYAGIVHTKVGKNRNYFDEAKRNLIKQIPNLIDINFNFMDYGNCNDISNYVIYCDPPYQGTTKYNTSKNFNTNTFWDWVRDKSKNNIVIVSELKAPNDFECIWEQEVTRTVDNTKRINSIEKLFVYKDIKS